MTKWIKSSIALKILGPVLGLMIAGFVGFGVYQLSNARKDTKAILDATVDSINGAVQASLRNAMVNADMDGVKVMLEEVGREKDVNRIYIANPAGKIRFAGKPAYLGLSVPEAARAGESTFSEQRPTAGGGSHILQILPILKEQRCVKCHEKGGKVIGYLGLEYNVTSTMNALAQSEKTYWAVFGTIVVALYGLIALLINLLVGRPLGRIAENVRKAADGDLTIKEIEVSSGDEIGILTDGFNHLTRNLRELVGRIVDRSSVLKQSADGLTSNSVTMSHAAEETSSQASVVSAAGEEVSKSSQTVASGVEEMSSSIKEIARNSSAAAKVAGDAVKVAQQTSAAMAKLGESSAEIGKVIKLITTIAGQTNLLALNASIEAAGAGEAGRGFAVVANEVKELAKEAAKATEEISRKIEGIQEGTKGAVDAIAQIGAIIGQISDISNSIASAIEEQTVTTSEISRNISQVAQGSAQIAQNISGMAQAAQSTAKGANDTQKAAADLAHMAAELQELVSRFKLHAQAVERA